MNKSTKGKERQLPANYHLGRFDVLCCRGKIALEHEGNCRFRAMVQSYLPQYSQSNCKVVKSRIVSTIVEAVRQGSPDGGFVKFVDDGWIVVNDRFAREKVGQTFRDLLHNKYKSSTKAKARAREGELISVPPMSVAPIHRPSHVSSGDSPVKLPSWVGSCPLPGAQTKQDTSLTSHLAWMQQLQSSSTPEPLGLDRLPSPVPGSATNALARTMGKNQEHRPSTGLVPNIEHHPNFLEQMIQGLDRSSTVTQTGFENHMTKSFGFSSLAAEESKPQPQLRRRHEMSVESSLILCDLEPLSVFPSNNDLQSASNVFSRDQFSWNGRL